MLSLALLGCRASIDDTVAIRGPIDAVWCLVGVGTAYAATVRPTWTTLGVRTIAADESFLEGKMTSINSNRTCA